MFNPKSHLGGQHANQFRWTSSRSRKHPKRRPAKKRKILTDSGEGRRPESRMAETQVTGIELSKTQARLKKKANRERVVSDSSDSSVAKTDAAASTIDEEKREVRTLRALEGGPSEVQAEVSMEVAVEPSEERTATVCLSLLPSEQTRSMGSEKVPQPKTSEELARNLTLSKEILEQIVTRVDETVVDAPEFPSPPPPEGEVRPEAEKKVMEEEPRESIVSFLDFLQYSVTPLLKYLDKKREKFVVEKEPGFYVELVRNRTQIKRAIAV